jgi:hypothetical protein
MLNCKDSFERHSQAQAALSGIASIRKGSGIPDLDCHFKEFASVAGLIFLGDSTIRPG